MRFIWRRKHRRYSLFQCLLLFMLLLIVTALLLTSTLSYLIFRGVIIDRISTSRVNVLQQIAERTRVIKNAALTVSNLYYSDPLVREVATDSDAGPQDFKRLQEKLETDNRQYQDVFEKTDLSYYAVFIAENGFTSCSLPEEYRYEGIQKALWFRKLMQSPENAFWIGGFNDRRPDGTDRYVFSLVRTFRREGEAACAALLVNVEESYLFETYRSALQENNRIYIVDENGGIVSHSDKQMIGISFFNMERFGQLFSDGNYTILKKADEDVLFSHFTDGLSGWTIVEEIPLKALLAPLDKVRLLIGLICLCVCGVAAAISYRFSRNISRPLGELCGAMERVEEGDLDVAAAIHGWEEVERLGGSFNSMLSHIKRLLEDVKEEERLKNKAEVDFLTAQINPHFLYNTLFSIKCMIQMGNNDKAEKMLSAFIELLKRTLTNPDEYISLSDEIDGVLQYMLIQKYRYANKIDLRVELSGRARRCQVPKLLLQPIVENAIFHGIEPKDGTGTIQISADVQGEQLFVDITDDGVGISPGKIEGLLDGRQPKQPKKRIGLANVHQRLRLIFGPSYGLTVESVPGKGTTVHFHLPEIE